jgi:hypothetical protein
VDSVYFSTPDIGWAVTQSANCLHWVEQFWEEYGCGNTPLRAVWGLDRDTAWAVGNFGQVLRWEKREGFWFWTEAVDYGEFGTFRAIQGFSSDDIWAAGDQIAHWDGVDWLRINGPPEFVGTRIRPTRYFDLSGTSTNDIWFVGDISRSDGEGVAIHWNGSGWDKIFEFEDQMSSISLVNDGDAWMSGEFLYRLHDGVWSKYSTDDLSFVDIEMLTANMGWAITYPDQLYRWDGSRWTSIAAISNGQAIINSIDFVSENEGWAAGRFDEIGRGAIFRWDGSEWVLLIDGREQ